MGIFDHIPKRFYRCNDGTYSDHARRGACNYHGGLKDAKPVRLTRTQQQKAAQRQKMRSGAVVSVPVQAVNVRREWFQGRATPYSLRSVDNILVAVADGKFRWVNMDPVTLWAAPDGKLYMLSGHSRLEAFNRLCAAGRQAEGRGFCEIPAKIVSDISLTQAKEIALQSNTLSTKETPLERAAYYAALRARGADEKKLTDQAKRLEGRNYTTILAYSRLNPTGKTITALRALEQNAGDSNQVITAVARWIGNARAAYPLTDSHENELYDWLITRRGYGTGSAQVSNEKEFKTRLQSIINRRTTFGVLEPTLNIQAFLQRSPVEQQYNAQLNEAKKAVLDAEKALKDKIRTLTARGAKEQQIKDITQGLEATLRRARIAYQSLVTKRADVAEAARNELSLFAGLSGKPMTHAELLQFLPLLCSENCHYARNPDRCNCKCGGKYHMAATEPLAYRELIRDLRKAVKVVSVGAITDAKPPGLTPCWDGMFSTLPHGSGVCSYHGGSQLTKSRKAKAHPAEAVAQPVKEVHAACGPRGYVEKHTFEYATKALKEKGVKFKYKTEKIRGANSIIYWTIDTGLSTGEDTLRMAIMNGGGGVGKSWGIRIYGMPGQGKDYQCSQVDEAVAEFVRQYEILRSKATPAPTPSSEFTKLEKSSVVSHKGQKLNVYKYQKSGTSRTFFAAETPDGQRISRTMYGRRWEAENQAKAYIDAKQAKQTPPASTPEPKPELVCNTSNSTELLEKLTGRKWCRLSDRGMTFIIKPQDGNATAQDLAIFQRAFRYYGYEGHAHLEAGKISHSSLDYTVLERFYQEDRSDRENAYLPTITFKEAYAAHRGVSHSPESRALYRINSAKDGLFGVYQGLAKGRTPEQLEILAVEWKRFADKHKEWMRDIAYADSNIVSVLVTGGSKFPSARNQKANDRAHAKREKFYAWEKKALARIRKNQDIYPELRTLGPIKSGESDTIDRLTKKLAEREALQAKMKEANKIIRSKKDVQTRLKALGFSDRVISEITRPDWANRLGFAPFQLSNNNAEIRRLKDRIAQEEKTQARQADGPVRIDFKGGFVEEDTTDNRLRIYFDEIPPADLRTQLKRRGWKWSRKNMAWQRQNTEAAWNNAAYILGFKSPMLSGIYPQRKLIAI